MKLDQKQEWTGWASAGIWTQGPLKKIDGGNNPKGQTWKIQIWGENTAAEKGKAVILAKGGAFQPQI